MSAEIPPRTVIDPEVIAEQERYHLMSSIVVPRPIGWISSIGENGVANVAPYSYFNVFSSNPPILAFSSAGLKDTVRNVRHTGDFVANIVTEDLAEHMNLTATDFPPDESEFSWVGLTPAPSTKVRAPRVAQAKISMECKVLQEIELGRVPVHVVFGQVLLIHVDPGIVRGGRVDPALLMPVGRLGGSGYTRVASGLFSIKRKPWSEVQELKPPLL